MAEMPMQAPPAGMPPGAPMEDEAPAQGGYAIVMVVMPDGQFSVGKTTSNIELEGANTADSAKDAFKMAFDIYQANPVSGGEAAQFEAGYNESPNEGAQGGPGMRF